MSQAPIKFAYWVPNVSGGLVISKIPQRTSWDIDYNRKLAQIAENAGFLNMNGGDTSITRSNPSLTAVGAHGIQKSGYLQVYAPITN